jgi:hypothetical protein
VKQEPLIEKPVSLIEWLAREVELSREEPAAGPLHLEMIVPGAPRISGRMIVLNHQRPWSSTC